MIIKIYGQQIEDDGTTYHIHIKKPIFGVTVALNSKIINQAIENFRWLHVTCPGAEETSNPWTWLHEGVKISKVFKIPTRPMILYQRSIGGTQPKPENPQLKLIND